ncbi:tubby-related protein 1-like [Planoprotostelium fungivorum]|uniref:Tubby-related protein 1-like n=1 Tax=Planoprotostelium fungivorum TaxID=1890364 RepID=A0A2P6NNK9_9EUKA|nr:tubby-related protein 1-like [Planoprotostelium fungivorum]
MKRAASQEPDMWEPEPPPKRKPVKLHSPPKSISSRRRSKEDQTDVQQFTTKANAASASSKIAVKTTSKPAVIEKAPPLEVEEDDSDLEDILKACRPEPSDKKKTGTSKFSLMGLLSDKKKYLERKEDRVEEESEEEAPAPPQDTSIDIQPLPDDELIDIPVRIRPNSFPLWEDIPPEIKFEPSKDTNDGREAMALSIAATHGKMEQLLLQGWIHSSYPDNLPIPTSLSKFIFDHVCFHPNIEVVLAAFRLLNNRLKGTENRWDIFGSNTHHNSISSHVYNEPDRPSTVDPWVPTPADITRAAEFFGMAPGNGLEPQPDIYHQNISMFVELTTDYILERPTSYDAKCVEDFVWMICQMSLDHRMDRHLFTLTSCLQRCLSFFGSEDWPEFLQSFSARLTVKDPHWQLCLSFVGSIPFSNERSKQLVFYLTHYMLSLVAKEKGQRVKSVSDFELPDLITIIKSLHSEDMDYVRLKDILSLLVDPMCAAHPSWLSEKSGISDVVAALILLNRKMKETTVYNSNLTAAKDLIVVMTSKLQLISSSTRERKSKQSTLK